MIPGSLYGPGEAPSGTRADYLRRLNAALELIDADPSADLGLARLARAAAFSPYHFRRIFRAMVGIPVHEYVKGARLRSAAGRLLHDPRASVTEIGLDSGFSSPSAFSRSFKKAFGASPAAYLRERRERPYRAPASARAGTSSRARGLGDRPAGPMGVEIRRLADIRVAYIRCVGLSEEFRNPAIESAYRRLFAWARRGGLVGPGTRVVGLTLDSPEVHPLVECRYAACITLPEGAGPAPDGEIGIMRVASEGLYAICAFDRASRSFARAFFGGMDCLYGSWLPDSGYYPADRDRAP